MGHKVHPMGFRIGVIRDWQAKWYADKHYVEYLQEDLKLRKGIMARYSEAGVSQVEIERQANKVAITIHTARPGIVIGRGGQRVDETRNYLEGVIGKRVQLNIQEVQRPELDAFLVAKQIAEQIERRVAYRRAMKQTTVRTIQAGAKGVRVSCSGRLGGAEIARRLTMHEGQVPLHTLRADIDYGFVEAKTAMGRIGVKVWIYKGDILPELKEEEEMAIEPAAVPTPASEAEAGEPKAEAPAVEAAPVAEKTEEKAAPVAEATVGTQEEAKPARSKRATAAAAEEPKAEETTAEAPAAGEAAEEAKPARKKRTTKAEAEAAKAETEEPKAEAPAVEEPAGEEAATEIEDKDAAA